MAPPPWVAQLRAASVDSAQMTGRGRPGFGRCVADAATSRPSFGPTCPAAPHPMGRLRHRRRCSSKAELCEAGVGQIAGIRHPQGGASNVPARFVAHARKACNATDARRRPCDRAARLQGAPSPCGSSPRGQSHRGLLLRRVELRRGMGAAQLGGA